MLEIDQGMIVTALGLKEESERGRLGIRGKMFSDRKEEDRCMFKMKKVSGGGSSVCIVIR